MYNEFMESWLSITLGVVGYLVFSTLLWYYWGRKKFADDEKKRKKCSHQLEAPEGTTVKCYHYIFRTLLMILFMGFLLLDPVMLMLENDKTKEEREAKKQKKEDKLALKQIKKEAKINMKN